MKIVSRAALLAFLTACVASPAWAGFQEGADAYNQGDYQTALNEWLGLAKAGDAQAQNAVGALYDHGLGVLEDPAEAFRWYSMAAQQNYPLAMRNLGSMYAAGRGVPYSLQQAQLWLGKAAAAGDQVAVDRLAALPPVSNAPVEPVKTPLFPGEQPAAPAAAAAPPDGFGANAASANLLSALDSKAMAAASAANQPAAATVNQSAEVTPASASVPPAAASAAAEPVQADTVPAEPASSEPAKPEIAAPAMSSSTSTAESPSQAKPLVFPRAEPMAKTAETSASIPTAAEAAVAAPSLQQASVSSPQPQAANWLLGQWQGPSLGCPPDGGMEFIAGETRSYFKGRIAVALKATYVLQGERIVVSNPGAEGSYTYHQISPDSFRIEAAPPVMPASIIGATYKRCGPAAVAMPEAKNTAVPASTTLSNSNASVSDTSTSNASDETATAAKAGDVKSGWDAFEKGDYAGALAIWKPQAEKGDANLQLLVGSMYDYGQGVAKDKKEALKWYLMAARQGSGRGQYAAGTLLARGGDGLQSNLVEAYKWLTLASRSLAAQPGQVTPSHALQLRSEIARQMSKGDIAKAESLAGDFHSQS